MEITGHGKKEWNLSLHPSFWFLLYYLIEISLIYNKVLNVQPKHYIYGIETIKNKKLIEMWGWGNYTPGGVLELAPPQFSGTLQARC